MGRETRIATKSVPVQVSFKPISYHGIVPGVTYIHIMAMFLSIVNVLIFVYSTSRVPADSFLFISLFLRDCLLIRVLGDGFIHYE